MREIEGHLRALLRDVLCGYLEADLKAVADDILLETHGEPLGEIEARDMRESRAHESEPRSSTPRFYRDETPTFEEPVTYEPELEWEDGPDYEEQDDRSRTPRKSEPVAVAGARAARARRSHQSADWGWDDPEDFSAPPV